MLPFPLRFDVAMKNIPGIMDPSLNGELQLDPENLLSSRNSIKLLSYITPATVYNKSGLLPHYCPWGMLLTSNHSFFSEVFNLGIPQFISLRKRQSLVITFLNLNLLIMVRKTQQCSQCEYKATTKSVFRHTWSQSMKVKSFLANIVSQCLLGNEAFRNT